MSLQKAFDELDWDTFFYLLQLNPLTLKKLDSSVDNVLHRVLTVPKCASHFISLLLEKGADVNSTNKAGISALVLAVQHGCRVDIIRTLLESGAKVNEVDSCRRSPLCLALHHPNCNPDVVELIIKHGATANACLAHSNVFYCYMNNPNEIQADILKLVLVKLFGLRGFNTQSLCLVLSYPRCGVNLVRFLLDMGCRFNCCLMHESSFHCYMDESIYNPNRSKQLKLDILELLLNNGSDIKRSFAGGQSPLCLALRHSRCSIDVIRLLLKAGDDINLCYQHNSPLHCYMDNAGLIGSSDLNAEVLKSLLEAGSDVNEDNRNGRSPLFMALHYFNCKSDVLGTLLDAGARLNGCLAHISLLYCYVGSNDVEEEGIRMILDNGADIKVTNHSGDTPLHCALRYSIYEVGAIKLLLDHPDTDIHAKGKKGSSYLHCALQNSFCELKVVELLLEKGARMNAVDSRGYTPLHTAVCKLDCNLDIIKLLLKKAPFVVDYGDVTALEIAIRVSRNHEVARLLLAAGASIVVERGDRKISFLELAIIMYDNLQCAESLHCLLVVLKFAILRFPGLEVGRMIDKGVFSKLHRIEGFSDMCSALLFYVNSCIREIYDMKSSYLATNFTLYDIVSTCGGDELKQFNIDALLNVLVQYSFHIYCDLISMKLNSLNLCDKLLELQVYSVVPDLQGFGNRKLILNGDIVWRLGQFLPVQDLLNFIVAFYVPKTNLFLLDNTN